MKFYIYTHTKKSWDNNDKLLFALFLAALLIMLKHLVIVKLMCQGNKIWKTWHQKKYKLIHKMIQIMQYPVYYVVSYMEIASSVAFWEAHEECQEWALGILQKIHLHYRNLTFKNRCGIAGGRMFHLSHLVYHV